MKIDIPENSYIKDIVINEKDVELAFAERKRVALVFISLNDPYWPYLAQVIKDCRQNFLPQHHVDYFAWTDYTKDSKEKKIASIRALCAQGEAAAPQLLTILTSHVRLYQRFNPEQVQSFLKEMEAKGLVYKANGLQAVIESTHTPGPEDLEILCGTIEKIISAGYDEMGKSLEEVNIIETEPVEWPAPTLMRYHLFLNEEERLKEYDYIFYLDADMRVVAKISDEILGRGLTVAPHPGYYVALHLVPPLEPNPDSQAFIPRLGYYAEENGKKRFLPFYAAGGFQGGKTKEFLAAMHTLKNQIDKDFNNNYTAIWNDESHWNQFLWNYQRDGGEITFLDVSYVYPDSLIQEYYVPKVWGKDYPPKIITLTKPFSLTSQGAEDLKKLTQ